jgi:hypothetical protein
MLLLKLLFLVDLKVLKLDQSLLLLLLKEQLLLLEAKLPVIVVQLLVVQGVLRWAGGRGRGGGLEVVELLGVRERR